MAYQVELLDSKVHDRDSFQCRDIHIQDYIRAKANKEHKAGLSDTFVLTDTKDPSAILGYFTLSNHAMSLKLLPKPLSKRLPRYPSVGTVLIGRMGRDARVSSKDLGQYLMKHACLKSLERGSFYAIELHAKSLALVQYYRRYGFVSSGDETHMFLPRATIEDALLSNSVLVSSPC